MYRVSQSIKLFNIHNCSSCRFQSLLPEPTCSEKWKKTFKQQSFPTPDGPQCATFHFIHGSSSFESTRRASAERNARIEVTTHRTPFSFTVHEFKRPFHASRDTLYMYKFVASARSDPRFSEIKARDSLVETAPRCIEQRAANGAVRFCQIRVYKCASVPASRYKSIRRTASRAVTKGTPIFASSIAMKLESRWPRHAL